MQEAELFKSFRDFTESSLNWCVKEAEEGTTRVTNAIDILLKDISRVSAMSSESLKALESLQTMLSKFDKKNYQQLQKSLASLSRENSEIDSYIQPIMEALQFQDRFRQNLENVVKMIDVWQKARSAMDEGKSSSDTLLDFGKALMAKTTMKRERDIIRAEIEGLEPEAEAARV
ncbi:MAG: hypothetical protein EOP07_16330, partial [Proteobacteria bacterium]